MGYYGRCFGFMSYMGNKRGLRPSFYFVDTCGIWWYIYNCIFICRLRREITGTAVPGRCCRHDVERGRLCEFQKKPDFDVDRIYSGDTDNARGSISGEREYHRHTCDNRRGGIYCGADTGSDILPLSAL